MSEWEEDAFKKILGMGGNKKDRESVWQGQDFWRTEEDGRSHTRSFREEYTRSL